MLKRSGNWMGIDQVPKFYDGKLCRAFPSVDALTSIAVERLRRGPIISKRGRATVPCMSFHAPKPSATREVINEAHNQGRGRRCRLKRPSGKSQMNTYQKP